MSDTELTAEELAEQIEKLVADARDAGLDDETIIIGLRKALSR